MSEKIARPIIRFLPPDSSKKPPDMTMPPKPADWGVPLQTFGCGQNGDFSTTKTTWNYNDSIRFCIIETAVPIVANVLFCAECHVDTRGAKLSAGFTASNYTVMAHGDMVLTTSPNSEARSLMNSIALKSGTCEIGIIILVNKGTGFIKDPFIMVWLTSMA